METSPSIKEITKALDAFRELVQPVTKDASNPFYKSKYATLDNILAEIKKPLADCGLQFAQFPDGDGLTTILLHQSGEWIKATANLHIKEQTPQGHGSAITYMGRNALSAALGLATEEDDDGNAASKPQTAPVTAKKAHRNDVNPKADTTPALAKADVDVLKMLVVKLGLKPATLGEMYDLIAKETSYDLRKEPGDFAKAVFTLEEKLEAKNA